MKRLASAGTAVAIALIATACVAATSHPKVEKPFRTLPTTARVTTHPGHKHPAVTLAVPARLMAAGLDLHAGPVSVPLLLQIPTLGINAAVVGVGIASTDAMDAPEGPAGDPVWQQAFWYRGSAIPGARSTALFAGHIDGPNGSSAVFTHLDGLRAGDPIVIHDTRSGLDVRFAVTATRTYTLAEAADPSVLKQIYGVGPVVGKWPQPSADGLSHLTLITCAGTFRNGTHDHRLAVYATRVG
jgi:hypothetical protein